MPTCQHSDVDLVQMGEKVDLEKDRLLERVRSHLSCLHSTLDTLTVDPICV